MLSHEVLWFILITGFVLARLGEIRLHRINYGFLDAMGVEELIPQLMRWYYRLPFLFLPIAVAEHYLWDTRHSVAHIIIGVTMVLVGTLLRLWAMKSLGRTWSMRCVAFPGIVRIRIGPYRVFAHPEYLSRSVEGMGLFIFGSAFGATLLFGVFSVLLALRVGSVEKRQLAEYGREFSTVKSAS